jgi:DMSO/TMAO reductase YedYZ molybdopterin-dependent catalytic subunit
MSAREGIDRRRFVLRSLGLAAASLLTGCDGLSQTPWVSRLLGAGESFTHRVQRALTFRRAMAREFPESARSAVFPSNGTTDPSTPAYYTLAANGFVGWRLEVRGLVERPARFSLAELRRLPARTQITRHDCVEGWSAIAKWTGVRLGTVLDRVGVLPTARYVVFRCADIMEESDEPYYESVDLEDAYHEQTILAYEMNDRLLTVAHGAPLRLRVERQLGYKMAKYVMAVELVERFEGIEGGHGGYWEDHGYEWYAGI